MAYSLTFVISVVIVPEITIPGFEGLIYGAVTTYSNQSQNVANAINNLLLATWPSNGDDAALRSCAPHANADANADANAVTNATTKNRNLSSVGYRSERFRDVCRHVR